VSRKHETLAALLFIGIYSVPAIAQRAREAAAPNPQITISVHDYADVPPLRLAAAEAQARRIFGLAGLDTVWLSCSPKLESEPEGCSLVDATHLVLKILSGKTNAHIRDRDDVLGNALLADNGTGYYAYAFLDHIETLEQHRGFAVLGYVLTHEIGHLLLGSNSHSVSGIMSPHWNDQELRLISEGRLLFLPNETGRLRERLKSRKVDFPVVTSAKAIALLNRTDATSTFSSFNCGVRRKMRWQNLDGNCAVEAGIAGAIDFSHAVRASSGD
jgi:hypothetical protein